MGSEKLKQSIYIPDAMMAEVQEEMERQERSFSWLMQTAWRIARERILAHKGVPPEPLP